MNDIDVGKVLEEKLLSFKPGSLIKGTIIRVDKEVIVDFGYKTEGYVLREEFKSAQEKIKPGTEVDLVVESLDPDPNGLILLSKEKADIMLNWDRIEKHFEEDKPISGTILQRVKGGFKVDIGILAFLPGSQTDLKPVTNPSQFVNIVSMFKIIKIDKQRKNVVVSRRKYLEEEKEEKKREFLQNLEKGTIVKGKVKNLVDYGAFIEIDNNIVGLLHLNDMAWGRITHPSQILSVGEDIEVMVLDINLEKQVVSFGLKQRTRNPWDDVDTKYPVGSIVEGKVVNITDYGAFIKLEDGIEGLLHISEFSWTGRVRHPSDMVAMGDALSLKVIDIKKEEQKISFSLRQMEQNPWPGIVKKYPVGSVVKGRVYHITEFGAFVEIEKGVDGLLHISNISDPSIKHPSEVLRKGQKIDVIVLEIDPEGKKISLGLKHLGQVQPNIDQEEEDESDNQENL
ncbi:MAG: S1 RNA-binding domain-containing protein [Candidatus Omnitrophica bacterium]|nr:S1 RNA-binding domain-containing protein [Candidatus Omnitrophota bacterium]MCM8788624.1 S1 RNA-binding domain-containing protein [Candidatus Omnitrophota bacterium]